MLSDVERRERSLDIASACGAAFADSKARIVPFA
jgi:hypothetical protein